MEPEKEVAHTGHVGEWIIFPGKKPFYLILCHVLGHVPHHISIHGLHGNSPASLQRHLCRT